jgi:hypothetical protein
MVQIHYSHLLSYKLSLIFSEHTVVMQMLSDTSILSAKQRVIGSNPIIAICNIAQLVEFETLR